VDSLAGLFDGVYYISIGESTSKADKLNNFCSMKILNTLLTQKILGIRTKRHVLEHTPRTKGCEFRGAWRMSFFGLFCRHTASTPISARTHTGGGAVIGKLGSTRLEGTPAMDRDLGLEGI